MCKILRLFFIIPVFSLLALEVSVNKIFSSEEKPEFWVYAPPQGKLFLRLYLIENPVSLLEDQLSPHSLSIKRQRTAARGSSMWHSFAENFRYSLYSAARSYMQIEYREALRKFLHLKPYAFPFSDYYPEKNLFPPLPYPLVKEWEYPLKKNRYAHRLSLENLKANFYLLEVSHGRKIAHVPLVVSDIAMLVKEGISSRFVYIFNPKNGEAIYPVELYVLSKNSYTEKLKLNSTLKLDRGLYYNNNVSFGLSQENLYLARYQNHFALSDIFFYQRSASKFKAAIYTDRPVYRQGHEVHVKGYVFQKYGFELRPYDGEGEVEIFDQEDKKVFSSRIKTNQTGDFAFSFYLAQDANLGLYSIRLRANGYEQFGHFYVEQYRKSEFRVNIESKKNIYFSKEKAQVIISANYYSGEPLRDTLIYYEIIRKRKDYPYWTNLEYSWYYADSYSFYEEREFVAQGEIKTNEYGQAFLDFDVHDFGDSDALYEVMAEVRGKTRETITNSISILVPRAEFRLELSQERWFYEPSSKVDFSIKALSYLNQDVTRGLNITVELWQKSWYEDKYQEKKIAVNQIKTNDLGLATGSFILPKESGNYEIRAWALDSQNRKAEDKIEFWVWQAAENLAQNLGGEIRLIPNKVSYEPKDTIELRIESQSSLGQILLVYEAEDIYGFSFVPENRNYFSLPVKDEFMPNFTISAHAFNQNKIYYGSREIIIPPKNKFLRFEISSEKEKFFPKEKAEFIVKVKDSQGKPVQANFSFAVVDEAIFAIKAPTLNDLGQFFYPRRAHFVSSADSLSFQFYSQSESVNFYSRIRENRERYLGEFKAMAKREEKSLAHIRQDFRDTAYFLANGNTDKNGTAKIEFTFPDNLTSWRITAHGATKEAQFGSTIKNVIVTKDFQIRLAQPRFLREEDYTVIGVVLQNNYSEKLTANLFAEVQNAELVSKIPEKVMVPAKSEIRLDLPLVIAKGQIGEKLKLMVSAQTPKESDALVIEIPIYPKGAMHTQVGQKILTGDEKSAQLVLQVDSNSPKIFRLFVTSGVIGTIEETLPYLIQYPYGCVEQTLSTFVPLQWALQLSQKLGIPIHFEDAQVKKLVEAGLSKIYNYQHSDGGWGWWSHDETNPYMTAYVLDALYQAKLAKLDIAPMVLEQGVSALREITTARQLSLEDELYARLVLSYYEKPSKESIDFIKSYLTKGKAKAYFSALIAQHMARLGYSKLHKEAIEILKKSMKKDISGIYFSGENTYEYYHYEDPLEITAQALLALSQTTDLMDSWGKDMVSWLLSRKKQAHWMNTRASALIVRALGEYALYTREKRNPDRIKITINQENFTWTTEEGKSQSFFWQKKFWDNRFTVDFFRTKPGFAQIRAEVQFWDDNRKTKADYFTVDHQYFLIEKEVQNNQIIYRPKKDPQQNFKVGDLVASISHISAKDNFDFILYEEFHPAGFERATEVFAFIQDESHRWEHLAAGRDFFDERTAVSKTSLFKNQKWRILNVFRAQYPGKYYSGFSQGGMMYYPEYNALSKGKLIAIQD